MCGLYSHRFTCLSHQVHLSVCLDICLCIYFPFTSTLGGGDVKGVLNNSTTNPNTSTRSTWYTRVYYVTPARSYWTVRNIHWTQSEAYGFTWLSIYFEDIINLRMFHLLIVKTIGHPYRSPKTGYTVWSCIRVGYFKRWDRPFLHPNQSCLPSLLTITKTHSMFLSTHVQLTPCLYQLMLKLTQYLNQLVFIIY